MSLMNGLLSPPPFPSRGRAQGKASPLLHFPLFALYKSSDYVTQLNNFKSPSRTTLCHFIPPNHRIRWSQAIHKNLCDFPSHSTPITTHPTSKANFAHKNPLSGRSSIKIFSLTSKNVRRINLRITKWIESKENATIKIHKEIKQKIAGKTCVELRGLMSRFHNSRCRKKLLKSLDWNELNERDAISRKIRLRLKNLRNVSSSSSAHSL